VQHEIDDEDRDECVLNKEIKINFCPMCGRRLSEENGKERQTPKENRC
jgi:hypothetical protein